MIHRMVDRIKEDIDPPYAPIVIRVRFLVGAFGEADVDANNPAWKVGVGS